MERGQQQAGLLLTFFIALPIGENMLTQLAF